MNYLSKSNALKIFNGWKEDELPLPSIDKELNELRNLLLYSEEQIKILIDSNLKWKNKKEYIFDLKFGLTIYDIFRKKYPLTISDASNDEVWIFLSMKVIPDIVYRRWGLSDTRFYAQTRRIWLRTIWWYIHLSWNNSIDETFEILENFTTDEIVQLVERSGPYGYRVDVTREIMRQMGGRSDESDRHLFRKVMKLNTARLKTVEPSLTQHGTKKYVEELIRYFEVYATR